MARLPGECLADVLNAAPPIARVLHDASTTLLETGSVARSTKELCAAMVCGVTFCTPLLVERRKVLRDLGVSSEKLTALWENARDPRYDDAERAALAAAVAISREPRALPDAIWDPLRAAYDDAEIVEILAVVAHFNALCRLANALAASAI